MRPGGTFAILIFISLLTAAVHSAGYPAEAKNFGYQLVPQGTGFSIVNFTCNGIGEYAIVSDGEPKGFLMAEMQPLQNGAGSANGTGGGQAQALSPITGKAGIANALHCYYVWAGHTESLLPGFSAIHAAVEAVKGAHLKGETGCRILLGTDRTPCVSFESCQKACYSVTSFCQPVALGAGRDFIDVMWMFENGSRELGAAYGAESAAYAAFAQNESEGSAAGYVDAIGTAEGAAERAAGSPLFYDYSYCFAPDYPFQILKEIQRNATLQFQDASHFYLIPALSGEIANSTKAAMEKEARFQPPQPELPSDGNGSGRAINASGGAPLPELNVEQQASASPLQDEITSWAVRAISFFLGLMRWI